MTDIYALKGENIELVVFAPLAGEPQCLHFGRKTNQKPYHYRSTEVLPASPDNFVRDNLFPQLGHGFMGSPAVSGFFSSKRKSPYFKISAVDCSDTALTIIMSDGRDMSISLFYAIDPNTDLLSARAEILNGSSNVFYLSRLVALTLPAPQWAQAIDAQYGSWSNEGRMQRLPFITGAWSRTARGGRTDFDGGPFLVFGEPSMSDVGGRCVGVALAAARKF